MAKKKSNADELISKIISGVEDVKGIDISLLDLRDIENTVCSYFIVCSGSSNTHVNAIVSSVQKNCKQRIKRETLPHRRSREF